MPIDDYTSSDKPGARTVVATDDVSEVSLSTLTQTLLRISPVPIFGLDRECRFLFVGEAAAQALERPASDIVGKAVYHVGLAPQAAADLATWTDRVLRTRQHVAGSLRFGAPADPRFYEIELTPLPDDRGEVAGVLVMAQKLDERTLADSEARLTLGMQVAGLALAEVDYSTGLSHLSAEAARMFGLSDVAVAVPRAAVHATFHPDDRPELTRRIAASLDPDGIGWFAMDHRVIRPDGEVRWLRVRKQIFFAHDGKAKRPERATLALIDVTAEKQAEEQLRAAHAKLRTVLSSINDGMLVLDREWRYTYFNEQGARIIGMRPEQLIGACVWDLFPHARGTRFYEFYHRAVESGERVQFEEFYPEPINKWLECHCYPSEEGLSVYFLDITERKRQQRQITDLNARLRRTVTESHHRIKNNLQMLNALVEMQVPDDVETVPSSELKRIGQHIRTLAATHDLLTSESKRNANGDEYSLRATLEKITPMLQIGAGTRPIRVRADEMVVSLKQAGSFALLVNELVSNALKHGRGQIDVSLTLLAPTDGGAGAQNRRARLEVCDDGPGFPADFDALQAANTGLELIDSLGRWDLRGEIRYANRPEGGAQVVVTFPLPDRAEAQVDLDGQPAGTPSRDEPLRPTAQGQSRDLSDGSALSEQAAETLRRSEERYRALVQATSQAVWMADRKGQHPASLAWWEDVTGQTVAQRQGWGWLDVLHPDDREPARQAWAHALNSLTPFDIEYRVRTRQGDYRVVAVRAIPILTSDGTLREWVGTLNDITEQRRAVEAIRLLNARLERAMTETHHRVRNNLQILLAILEALSEANMGQTVSTEKIAGLIQHVSTLGAIHDMLTEQAKIAGDARTLSTSRLLHKLLALLQRVAYQRRLDYSVAEAVLPTHEATSLALVTNELVSNALKYSRSAVEIRFTAVDDVATLVVLDDGHGFAADFAATDPAYTGLELVHSLVAWDLHGALRFQNRAEGGAIVTVTFPVPAITPQEQR